MKNKHHPALLATVLLALLSLSGCDSKTSEEEPSAEFTPTVSSSETTVTTIATKPRDIEEIVGAAPGDAILAVVDEQWYVQYWGNPTDLLAYDAGIATIHGNGYYTVSVNAATKGCSYELTGDTNGTFLCNGIDLMMIQVINGEKLFPDMAIEITEIRVDGKKIELAAQNYTYSEDGSELRAPIYSRMFNGEIPDGAHDAKGFIASNDTEHSACIVNPDDFAEWQKLEVDFIVSGCGEVTTAPTDTSTSTIFNTVTT